MNSEWFSRTTESTMAMMELVPIWSRVFWDVVAILLQTCFLLMMAPMAAPDASSSNLLLSLLLAAPLFITIVTSGPSFTNRWTLTIPMVPFILFEGVRLHLDSGSSWISTICYAGSIFWLCMGALLSLLFPPVQLPPVVNAKYKNVGVVDLHLPVDKKKDGTQQYVSVRLLYPMLVVEEGGSNSDGSSVPYLNPNTAVEFCRETMKLGAPRPLKPLAFMLHNYRLIKLQAATRNAAPTSPGKMPICIYSHGLGGTYSIYSYQALNLAASGRLVMLLDHTDGSAPVIQNQDGSLQTRDEEIIKLWQQGEEVAYVRARRAFTDHRVREFLAATNALLDLNRKNIVELESLGISFIDKLDTDNVTFMGHSFGGATALTAAHRYPQLAKCVVAHEPAMDWVPDDARSCMFSDDLLQDSQHSYSGGTGGYESIEEEEKKENDNSSADKMRSSSSLHDLDLLFLYSDEWWQKQWGCCHLVQCMHQRGLFSNKSDVGVIKQSYHTEFSDTCMLTPTWLARGVGMTGQRNPIDTAQEIASRTLQFLENVDMDEI